MNDSPKRLENTETRTAYTNILNEIESTLNHIYAFDYCACTRGFEISILLFLPHDSTASALKISKVSRFLD